MTKEEIHQYIELDSYIHPKCYFGWTTPYKGENHA